MSTVDIDIEGVWPNNFCLGEAQCALGIVELKTMEKTDRMLIAQGEKIKAGLADTPEITFVKIPAGYRHVFHQFVMHFDASSIGKCRNDLIDFLVFEKKIRSIVQYYPLYRFPLFQKLGAGQQDCPVLESWWDNTLSFPWWCGMDDETIDYLVTAVKDGIARLKG